MLNSLGGARVRASSRRRLYLPWIASTAAAFVVTFTTTAAAYTWAPSGIYYAVGRETVSTPGGGTLSCDAFWNLEVTKDGEMRVLEPGAPLCSIAAYELPWRVTLDGPDTGVVPKVLFQGTALTFCRGKLKVSVKEGTVVLVANGPMASGCSFSARVKTDPKLHIAP